MAEDPWSRLGRELLELERERGPDAAHKLWNDGRGSRARAETTRAIGGTIPPREAPGTPTAHKHPPPDEAESLERDWDVRRERPWLQ